MKNFINDYVILNILRIICLVCLLSFLILSFLGNSVKQDLDMDKFYNTATYVMEYELPYLLFYPELEDTLIDSTDILDLDSLIQESDYVLKIKIDEYEFYKSGLLSICTVNDVIKGDNIKKEDSIRIFEHIADLVGYPFDTNYERNYLIFNEGMIPMQYDEEYIVFLKKTPDQIDNYTFMFTTDKYGAFRITNSLNVCKGYTNVGLSLSEASKFDIISYSNNIDEKKVTILKEIYERYK